MRITSIKGKAITLVQIKSRQTFFIPRASIKACLVADAKKEKGCIQIPEDE